MACSTSATSRGAASTNPKTCSTVGQQIQVRILKIDPDTKKISLGLKQLQPEPWARRPSKYQVGQRITGAVTRLADFGAFVEIEPGVEGLIHISEMSWGKKVRHPSDVLKQGDRSTRSSLASSPKSAASRSASSRRSPTRGPRCRSKFPVGSQVEGPVTKLMKFGAFVQIADGIEGLVHISEISADRRINHPSDVLRAGQVVKAQVLAIDAEKRQIKLSMKQLIPTSIDEYIAEHKAGDMVSGRVVEESAAAQPSNWAKGSRTRVPSGKRARRRTFESKATNGASGSFRAFDAVAGALEGKCACRSCSP